jgi:hypothetical protein
VPRRVATSRGNQRNGEKFETREPHSMLDTFVAESKNCQTLTNCIMPTNG